MEVVFFFVLGLAVGSFLNVVILRFGFAERANTRSACASCGTTLAPHDLIPVVSYLWLKGRCRHCGSALSTQYPVVELLVASLFALLYAVAPDLSTLWGIAALLTSLGFWTSMVGVVVYDLRHTLTPMPFIYALWIFGLLHAAALSVAAASYLPLIDALLGAVVVGGFFATIHFVTRGRGMGIGDAYIGFAIGLFGLGQGILAASIGIWAGAAVGLLALLIMKVFPHVRFELAGTRVTLSAELPFAPFLALGALAVTLLPGLPALFGLSDLIPWLALSLF